MSSKGKEEQLDDSTKDLSFFDKSVTDLFKVCKSILKAAEKRKLTPSERKNPFLSRLEKYEKIYIKSEPHEHTVYFEKIFNNYKKFILLGPQRDNWLLDNEVMISYGEDCGLKMEAKLHLSSIYRTASKMRDEIKEEMEGLPNMGESGELIYPSVYLLFLYRIFLEICESDNDKKKLGTHIGTLENETGLTSNKSMGNTDGLGDIFEAAASMAEQVSGQKIARDKLPGKNDFGKMLGQIVNDPKTKNVLGSVMEKFKNTENIGDIMTTLVDSLGSMTGPQSNNSQTSDNSQNLQLENSSNNNASNNNASNNSSRNNSSNKTLDVNDEFSDAE